MKIGFIGLGKMGQQMVSRLAKAGHEVVVTDVNPTAIATAEQAGATGAADRAELVKALGERPVVWLMIPAGAVQAEVAALLELLPAAGIVVDGGNSDFRQTLERAKETATKQVELVDVGTSGGVMGLAEGFSMMVGGSDAAVAAVQPALETLAQSGGWGHFGPVGSGHFIKMVHNAIEYGLMEAYAEGYRLLHENPEFTKLNLGAIGAVWQHGSVIRSHLNEISAQVLHENPSLEGIDGYVAESGETRWTLELAKQVSIEAPVIQAAFDVRVASEKGQVNFATKLLAAMRNVFGGHQLNK
jgi:6-phosphogluconate dehydrogenase